MANTIRPEDLGNAIRQELTLYEKDIREKVGNAGLTAIKELVKKTKATAPRGKRTRHFYQNIAYEKAKEGRVRGTTFRWYVKAPDYRLTHLLVNGHQTRDGGRTKADPFLRNALDEVLPQYESKVEEVIKNE